MVRLSRDEAIDQRNSARLMLQAAQDELAALRAKMPRWRTGEPPKNEQVLWRHETGSIFLRHLAFTRTAFSYDWQMETAHGFYDLQKVICWIPIPEVDDSIQSPEGDQ